MKRGIRIGDDWLTIQRGVITKDQMKMSLFPDEIHYHFIYISFFSNLLKIVYLFVAQMVTGVGYSF